MVLPQGTKLGSYEIVALLGAGGMGQVYAAKDTRLGRQVAIKVLPAEFTKNDERVRRFMQEAKAASALNHPNIITVHDIGESDHGHFIVMELVSGRTLRAIAASQAASQEFMASLLPVFLQMAKALNAAHGAGITHRDIKPENVMVRDDAYVKVLDFGLARLAPAAMTETDETATQHAMAGHAMAGHTMAGQVLGTVKYMSPEQALGAAVGPPSDVFSLGLVFYELAAGKHPFQAETQAQTQAGYLLAITAKTAPALSKIRAGIPAALDTLIARMLSKEPEGRPTVAEVMQALEGISSFPATPAPPADAIPASTPRKRPGYWIGLAVLVILAGLAAVFLTSRSAPKATTEAPAIRSIAVLPLDNYSGDPSQEYFAEGVTDQLTADLANISKLRVISRGSATQFQGKQRPPAPEIAKTLNVDAIVEGSVSRFGEKVRITIQLIDARADRHLWSKNFERSSRDVLALQADLASAVATEIHVQLTPTEESRLTKARSVNTEAYDTYLKGRYFFNRPSDENLARAISKFEESVKLDPSFAPAFSGLSDAYLWAGFNEGFLTATEAKPKAKAASETAIQLDNNSAEAHTSVAVYKLFYDYDWASSEAEFRRAFALNPNYAFAHDQFSLSLAFQGRLDESIAESKRASDLDPLSPQIPVDGAAAYVWQGKFQVAREQLKRAADLDPAFFFPIWGDGWVDLQIGKLSDAVPKLRKSKSMAEAPTFVSAWLGYAYGISGDRTHALTELEDLKKKSRKGYIPAFNLALVHLGLGDRARALEYLERAYASDSQWLCWLRGDRIFDPLRAEPRFVALMKKLRFEK